MSCCFMTCTLSALQLFAGDFLCEHPEDVRHGFAHYFFKFLVMKLHENRVL